MKNDPDRLYNLLQSIEGIVWEADADMQQFLFISDHVKQITGFAPEIWLTQPGFWKTRVHPDDKDISMCYASILNENNRCTLEYRMIAANGETIWIKDTVFLTLQPDGSRMLHGVMLDNSVSERLRALERLERDVLRLNSDVTMPLGDVLYNYLQGLEALFPHMQCSIHRIRNNRVMSSISPSLSPDYINAIVGMPTGKNEGSCGTAAATGKQVIVVDIASDRRWKKYRHLALSHQLRACWSNPVTNSEGKVIATLAMYYGQSKSPSIEEQQVMEKATALLRIILENRQKNETINEAHLLMLQSQELAHFGNWQWDVQEDLVSWSPALYSIYGLNADEFKATFAGYQERLHPDDRDRVRHLIETVLSTGNDAEFEERIIRPNGELRHLRSWAKLKTDGQGLPMEMIGACLDVTERIGHIHAIEERNRQLSEIAWMQSHLIRSPLAKIMALVELIQDTPNSEEKNELYNHVLASAHELDTQVKNISNKSSELD